MKWKTRMGALACAAALVLSLVPAAAAAEGPAVSKNINYQDYITRSTPVYSYLMENNNGGLTRVEYIDGQVVVEDYSAKSNPAGQSPWNCLSGAVSLPGRTIISLCSDRETLRKVTVPRSPEW